MLSMRDLVIGLSLGWIVCELRFPRPVIAVSLVRAHFGEIATDMRLLVTHDLKEFFVIFLWIFNQVYVVLI